MLAEPLPKLKDKKIYNFSPTQIGGKRRRQTAEPIETVIISGQQKFEIENGLNPVEIEINDDRILNILKKQKKCKTVKFMVLSEQLTSKR